MKITASNNALYSTTQVYALDAAAIASGIPGIQLMKRAGRTAFELLLERYPAPDPRTGGVVARLDVAPRPTS